MNNNVSNEEYYKRILEFQLSLNFFGCEVLKKEQEKGCKIKISDIKLLIIKNLVLDYFKNNFPDNHFSELENYFTDLQNCCEISDHNQIIDMIIHNHKELLNRNITGQILNFLDNNIEKIFKNYTVQPSPKHFYRSYYFTGFLIYKKIHEILSNTNGIFPEHCYQLMQIIDERNKKITRYLKNSTRLDIQDRPLYENFYNYFVSINGKLEKNLEPSVFLFLLDQTTQNLPLWLIKHQLGLESEKINFYHLFNTRTPGEKKEVLNGIIVFLDIQKKYKNRRIPGKSNTKFEIKTLIWDKNSETLFYVKTTDNNSNKNSTASKLKNSGIGNSISFSGKHVKTIELLLGDEKIHAEIIKNMRIKKILTTPLSHRIEMLK